MTIQRCDNRLYAFARSHSVAGGTRRLCRSRVGAAAGAGCRVCRIAGGPPGHSRLRPSTDEEWIGRQHQLTGEVRLVLEEQVSIPLGGLFDPTQLGGQGADSRRGAGSGGAAEPWRGWPTMWPRGRRCCSRRPRGWWASCRGLSALSSALTTSLRPLAESIERTIQPDGSLADNASPELGRIRREQERQQRSH